MRSALNSSRSNALCHAASSNDERRAGGRAAACWRTADRRRRSARPSSRVQPIDRVGRAAGRAACARRSRPVPGAIGGRASIDACVARRDRDERAFGRQRPRDGEAEPLARAADHRHFALQPRSMPLRIGLIAESGSLRLINLACATSHCSTHVITRSSACARRRVERAAGAPRRRRSRARRAGAALPSGSPCRCLPGTRTASAAPPGRTRRPASSISAGSRKSATIRTRISGNAKPVIAPVRAGHAAPRAGTRRRGRRRSARRSPSASLQNARGLERRRRILELDRARARESRARSAPAAPAPSRKPEIGG